mmetsp:Transcript_173945/g.557580  ORF Transcript_173945/g.557580 Transcript_173945/m.557580 type:complete len:267 (-) Transcript_173945:215-1015(-)
MFLVRMLLPRSSLQWDPSAAQRRTEWCRAFLDGRQARRAEGQCVLLQAPRMLVGVADHRWRHGRGRRGLQPLRRLLAETTRPNGRGPHDDFPSNTFDPAVPTARLRTVPHQSSGWNRLGRGQFTSWRSRRHQAVFAGLLGAIPGIAEAVAVPRQVSRGRDRVASWRSCRHRAVLAGLLGAIPGIAEAVAVPRQVSRGRDRVAHWKFGTQSINIASQLLRVVLDLCEELVESHLESLVSPNVRRSHTLWPLIVQMTQPRVQPNARLR